MISPNLTKTERIDLGPKDLLDLTLLLDRSLLADFQQTADKLQLSVEAVTVELIQLFVRQSPAMDRRGLPLVGFLNLGRFSRAEVQSASPSRDAGAESAPKGNPRRGNQRKRERLLSPAEIAAACEEIRRGREVTV